MNLCDGRALFANNKEVVHFAKTTCGSESKRMRGLWQLPEGLPYGGNPGV